MAAIIPYLAVQDKKCREAFEFYKDAVGGELDFVRLGDSPGNDNNPDADLVMHVALTGTVNLYGCDNVMGGTITPGDNVRICYVGTVAEITAAFDKLSDGGKVRHALETTFFGTYGDLTDKYGFGWMFQADKED